VGQQKSFLLSLPHSSGGISAADVKKTGPSFFTALIKFFTKPSFIRSGGKILSQHQLRDREQHFFHLGSVSDVFFPMFHRVALALGSAIPFANKAAVLRIS
jgi:hypothetical protein